MKLNSIFQRRFVKYIALVLTVAVGLTGCYLLLRESSLVAVDEVEIVGLSGPQSKQVKARLREAATGMTTLSYSKEELLSSIDDFPQIADLKVKSKLLHRLDITVVQRRVVALLVSNGVETPISFDGTLLKSSSKVSQSLPVVKTNELPKDGQIKDKKVLSALKVIEAAPREFISRIRQVTNGRRGLTAEFRSGQKIYFGSDAELKEKWQSAVSVLATEEAKGASYVDVQVPDRPAVGGVTPSTTQETIVPTEQAPVVPTTTTVVPETTAPVEPVVPTEQAPVQ